MMPFPTSFVSWIPTNNCCLDKNKIPSKSLEVNSSFEKGSGQNILTVHNPFTLEFSDSLNKECELGIEYKIKINFNSSTCNLCYDLLKYGDCFKKIVCGVLN